ncbi:hypothetical protein Golob_004515, partial [Gossypium lobatum]|nr:hypothetical protein [Gossypium lobatum]
MVGNRGVFEGEVKRLWDCARGDIYVKLERVREGLCDWAKTLRLGDKNTTFFHNYASQQRRMNKVGGFSTRMESDSGGFISALVLVARNERGEVLGSKSILVKEIAFPFTIEACACSQADLRIDEEDARCRYLGRINELLWELKLATRKVILRKVEWVAVHHFDWT